MRVAFLRFVRRFTVAASLLLLPLSVAEAATALTPATAASAVAPGRFVWRGDAAAAAAGPVRVLVSLPLQIAFVFKGGALVGVSSVSSGAPGYDTPTGTFAILQKDKDHKSNIYDDAPMPYMLRLTWDGVALHAGKVTGEPASHGCVRLPLAFAKKLYDLAELGATVSVVDAVPDFVQQAPAAEGNAETAETASR
ncbi:MAG: L,D-transpeptidase family protein [Alphaproteobacteria bacterium]|nr:L,D-transpeptidase family protein [Alphaproteobacteria bacterium]